MRPVFSWWLALAFSVMASFFTLNEVGAQSNGVWKIGAVLCTSGACASYGVNSVRGAQIAIDEINASGGVLGKKVELVVQDTNEATSGSAAVSAYRQLRTDKSIQFYIGPSWSPAGLALAPIIAKEKDVVIMSPSIGVAEFHKTANNIFNARGSDEANSRKDADYVFAQGLRRAAIFSSQQPWESAQADFFEDEFKKLGGIVETRQEPLPTVGDVSAEVAQILSKKPEVVFLSSVVLLASAAKKLRQMGYAGPILASQIDPTRIAEAQGALEDAVFFSFKNPQDEFVRKFQERYSEPASLEAAISYDIVKVFSMAVTKAKTFEVSQVIREISAISTFGASGVFSFDREGGAIREVAAFKVINSKLQPML